MAPWTTYSHHRNLLLSLALLTFGTYALAFAPVITKAHFKKSLHGIISSNNNNNDNKLCTPPLLFSTPDDKSNLGVIDLTDDDDDDEIIITESSSSSSSDDTAVAAPFLSQGELSDDPNLLNPDFTDPKQTRVIIYIILTLVPVLFLIPLMIGSRDLIPLDALPPVEMN
jgi:hypothetical protein